MDPYHQPSLAPGERLNKYGQVYNFEEWKAKKIADGTWIENMDEWKQRKQAGTLPAAPPSANPYPPYQAYPPRPAELVPPPPPPPVPREVQFPPRVLPHPSQMGEGMLDQRPKFNILPPSVPTVAPTPTLPVPTAVAPSGPPAAPPTVTIPSGGSAFAPVPTEPVTKISKKSSKKPDDWIPLKEFIENRKRRGEEYAEREQKVIKMSEQYESSDDMSRRVVIFDTETTGLGSEHEIVEIAMIETIEGIKTGRYLHFFINPDGENTKKAYEIHRLTKESLSSHPKFWQVARRIAAFVGSSSLMAHNASFDMDMLNRGMIKAGLPPYPPERFICTKKMSKALFPDERASQDHLCHKFGVDNFNRETTGIHSAIEDTSQLYHIFRGMIPLLEKKNLCWSQFRLS